MLKQLPVCVDARVCVCVCKICVYVAWVYCMLHVVCCTLCVVYVTSCVLTVPSMGKREIYTFQNVCEKIPILARKFLDF